MLEKKKPNYTSAEIENHLARIRLDYEADPSLASSSGSGPNENLEAMAIIVKMLQESGTEQYYLRRLDQFVEEKEREIEQICDDNYEVSEWTRFFS